jgi:4-hydroxybenzoate polyprenyltransferase
MQFPITHWLVAVGLGILTLSHVLWQRAKRPLTSIIKDANVALVYTVGAWSIPIAMAGSLDLNSAVVLSASILLVFVNVIWLSVLDHTYDAEARSPSIAIAMGVDRAATLARLLSFVVMAILLVWMMYGGDVAIGITLLCMALIYAVVPIIRLPDPDIARLYLELVLVLPLWLLFL